MRYKSLNLEDKKVSFDTEATGLNPWGDYKRWGYHPARPFAFSFCDSKGNSEFIRWEVDPKTRQVIINEKDMPFIRSILEDNNIAKIGHNIGFDIRMSEMIGIKFAGKVYDTLIMTHVVTGGGELSYGLKPICKKYLEIEDNDEVDLINSVKKNRRKGIKLGWCLAKEETHGHDYIKADYWLGGKKLLEKYAILDATRAMMLFLILKDDIGRDKGLFETFKTEMELFWHVKAMEDTGIRVFPEEINKLEIFYLDYMKKQQKIVNKNGGKGLNFNSPKQMQEKFIIERKHKPLRQTEKGNPKTDGEFLLAIADKDPLAKAILEYKAAEKGINTFLRPYKKFMVKENNIWVIHPNYKQCGTKTGRFSSSDPNLMQVASEDSGKKRAEVTLYPRKCFGPRDGYVWYAPDYSQEEVWLCMFHAQEENGMKYLLSGKSFHDQLTTELWKNELDFEKNKKSYKKRTKIIVFTKFYGGGKNKIAMELDCTVEEACVFIEKFNMQLPRVDRFMEIKTSEARNRGFIRTSFGRKCAVHPELCYKGMNYDIQGTAADIIKRAMIRLAKKFTGRWSGVRMILTLHDELIIEVPLRLHSKSLMRDILEAMQADSKQAGIPVPLPVSMKIMTKSWAQEIKLCNQHLKSNCLCES